MLPRSKELLLPNIKQIDRYFHRQLTVHDVNPIFEAIERVSQPLADNLRNRRFESLRDTYLALESTWRALVISGVNQFLSEPVPALKSLEGSSYVAKVANATAGRWYPDNARLDRLWTPGQELPERFEGDVLATDETWRLVPAYINDPKAIADLAHLMTTLLDAGFTTPGRIRRSLSVVGNSPRLPESRLKFAQRIFNNTPPFDLTFLRK